MFEPRLGHRDHLYDAADVMRWTARDARSLGVGLVYVLPSSSCSSRLRSCPLGWTAERTAEQIADYRREIAPMRLYTSA